MPDLPTIRDFYNIKARFKMNRTIAQAALTTAEAEYTRASEAREAALEAARAEPTTTTLAEVNKAATAEIEALKNMKEARTNLIDMISKHINVMSALTPASVVAEPDNVSGSDHVEGNTDGYTINYTNRTGDQNKTLAQKLGDIRVKKWKIREEERSRGLSVNPDGGTNTKKYRRRNKRKTKHYKKKAKRYTKKRNMRY